jgi:zinc/manganese transport system substrate-binding protein
MATLDPAQQSHYRAGAAAASEALLTLAALERERFAALPESDRQIASYHASLPYLLDWLSLRQIATLEPRPGVPPTPGHTAQVISTMRSDGARAIVQESYYPASTSETIATLVGGAVVRIDSGPNLAAQETTVDWLTRTAEAIYVALH